MKCYFKPEQTDDKLNYYVTQKRKNGQLFRSQLPQEGIYTEYEMSMIIDKVPGNWVNLNPSQVGFIFGLRQQLTGK